jgi:hypothetical protein
VLAEPLTDHTLGMGAGPAIDDELNRELDEELGLLESETAAAATPAPPRPAEPIPLPPLPPPRPAEPAPPRYATAMTMDW